MPFCTPSTHAAYAVLASLAALAVWSSAGCGPQTPAVSNTRSAVAAQPIGREQVVTVAVKSYPGEYIEQIDVPGASVHGYETAELMAEVGGQVKQIGKVANAAGELQEADIGAQVKRGDVLAVLNVPLVQSELLEKAALVAKASSEVKQAEANTRQKSALTASAQAALEEAATKRAEQEAIRTFRQADYDNYLTLFQQKSTTKELLDRAKSQLDAAKAALNTVAAQIRTSEKMLEAARVDGERAVADLATAEAQVKVAAAAEARLRAMVEFATIRAPFDGVITERMVDHGSYVRPATSNSGATPLFRLTRNDRLRVRADVPARRAERIAPSQGVVFHSITGVPGITVEAAVTRTAVVRDRDVRTLRIEVDLPRFVNDARYFRKTFKEAGGKPVVRWVKQEPHTDDESIELKPGMDGVVTILRPWSNLVSIPSTALAFDAGRPYVMTVSDGVCARRYLDLVYDDTADALISGGISPGEQVVRTNPEAFSNGDSVVALLRETAGE